VEIAMTTELSAVDLASLYDRDIVAWSEQTASLLQQGKFGSLDLAHLIDEVQDLGRRERDKLRSSIRLILHHLLKWQYQPAYRSRSWVKTIQRERVNLQAYLDDAPSLKCWLSAEELEKLYRIARKDAAIETELPIHIFPAVCPYVVQDVLNENFPANLTNS
jgi:hypothetical protein